MRFFVICLSILVITSFIPATNVNAQVKCNVNTLTSAAYYKCKAKQVGGWFKKKGKSAGKKIGESGAGKKFKELKKKKTLME